MYIVNIQNGTKLYSSILKFNLYPKFILEISQLKFNYFFVNFQCFFGGFFPGKFFYVV